MKLRRVGWAAIAVYVAALAMVRADDGRCPDEKATVLPAEVVESLAGETCSVKIQMFGLSGVTIHEDCPAVRIHLPERGFCLGEEQVGSRCTLAGWAKVTVETCGCEPMTAGPAWAGVEGSVCTCTPSALFASVPDYATSDC